jgi:hypothetical protein
MNMLCGMMLLCCAALPSWNFDSASELETWKPNDQLTDISAENGILHCRAIDFDPFLLAEGLSIPAAPWQYVSLRIRADRDGMGELFWTGDTAGKYGGLSQKKTTRFNVRGGNEWQEIAIFPFWHREQVIKTMRLDLYDGATFDIDWIRIAAWGGDAAPVTDRRAWHFENGIAEDWGIHPASTQYFSPPLKLDTSDAAFVAVHARSGVTGEGRVRWANAVSNGAHSESFSLRDDGVWRWYNVEVQSYSSWDAPIVALGLDLPDASVEIGRIELCEDPAGPPDVRIAYFGFENGHNRAGRDCPVLVHLMNDGSGAQRIHNIRVETGEGLVYSPESLETGPAPGYGEVSDTTFTVSAEKAGVWPVRVSMRIDDEDPLTAETTLTFLPAREITPAEYVPAPQPIESSADILAYYFPGWATDAAWDCIRRVAPIRKPLLGYYDESNPEVVDWQIKWALENGISCFLVDWYWNQGGEHLKHWFEAYRKARYRDMLDVAIMWANHNPPGSHTREDWINVTREWIENYFNLPAYYRIDNKPAVFLWDPSLIRIDLGGLEAVRDAFDESQAMAEAAGYEGIVFVSVNHNRTESNLEKLAMEGYYGHTNYHEFGRAPGMGESPKWNRYRDIVATAPAAWDEKKALHDELIYYPLADTGWDPRPWHGSKSTVFAGRDVPLWHELLTATRKWMDKNNRDILVLGPMNEWGEGSYIEPATEYSFGMYESIRDIFGKGDRADWPENLSPEDLGLGPYDFPPQPSLTAWEFEDSTGGWSPMMNMTAMRIEDGCLVFRTTSDDAAIQAPLYEVRAEDWPALAITMRLEGSVSAGSACQIFWSAGGAASNEATSMAATLETDGAMHTYTFPLHENRRWRGRISRLRFDPCADRDVRVRIAGIRFIARDREGGENGNL